MYISDSVISPFLRSDVLNDCELKPEARVMLHEAQQRGFITPKGISDLFPVSILKDRAKFSKSMAEIAKLLQVLNVKVEISVNHIHAHTHVHKHVVEVKSPAPVRRERKVRTDEEKGPKRQAITENPQQDRETENLDSEETVPETEAQDPIKKYQESLERAEAAALEETEPDNDAIEESETGEDGARFIFDKDDKDKLNPYYRAVCNYPLLPHEQILELAEKARMGDVKAFKTMVCHNLRWVLKLASKHLGRGLDYDDLVQEGNMGLMEAVEKFDPTRGHKLTTYATWWIRSYIGIAIVNFGSTIRIPAHIQEKNKKIWRITRELLEELGREPTLEEISARSGIPVKHIQSLLKGADIHVNSLDDIVWSSLGDGSEKTLGEVTPDAATISPDLFLEMKEARAEECNTLSLLLATLQSLPIEERSRDIFKAYYSLDGVSEDLTLDELGQKYGVTRERIRQINARVMEELQAAGIAVDEEEIQTLLCRKEELDKLIGEETTLTSLEQTVDRPYVGLFRISPDFTYSIGDQAMTAEVLLSIVSVAYGVEPHRVRTRREWKYKWVRNIFTHLLKNDLKYSRKDIQSFIGKGWIFGKSYRNTLDIIGKSEAAREDIARIRAVYQPETKPLETTPVSNASGVHEEIVLNAVAEICGITREILVEKGREAPVARARNIACYLLRTDSRLPFSAIGELLGSRDHTTIMSNVEAVETVLVEFEDDIREIRALYNKGPEAETLSAISDPVWRHIVLNILTEVSTRYKVTIATLTRKGKSGPAGEGSVILPRQVAIYLCEHDFTALSSEVQQVFNVKAYTSLAPIRKKIEERLTTDTVLQKQVEEIRNTYTLAFYNHKLNELQKRQKTLFPKQTEEVHLILDGQRKKLSQFISILSRVEVLPRSREMFNLKYGFNDSSFIPQSLEWVGEHYGITRERVRQIIIPVWDKLVDQVDIPFGTPMLLEEALEEYQAWQKLVNDAPKKAPVAVKSVEGTERAATPSSEMSPFEKIKNAVSTIKGGNTQNILFYLLVTDLKLKAGEIAKQFNKKESDVYKAVIGTSSLIKDKPEVREQILSIRALCA